MSSSQQAEFIQSNILIVDDCLDNVELLATILVNCGYKVLTSDRGTLAIEQAKNDTPDLILLDICMPELNGLEFCQILKEDPRTQNIPIIFLSALQETETKAQAFKLGGDDYITKPFNIEEVLIRVENQLKKYRWQSELKAHNIRLEQENLQLNRLATVDSLTNIANRHYFEEFLSREWYRGIREQFSLSLILADIDYFKLYNDRFGHRAGDLCLQKVAGAISNTIKRPADLVARYGGEEFAIILPQTPANNALHLAEKIRLEVKRLNLAHPESCTADIVSLSLGVASVVPSPKYTIEQLIVTADKALYRAKKQGRDRSFRGEISAHLN
ncbi:MAG: diguanylate cyclase [Cyanobacteria bacterium P01_G01_bin.19]